jgi:diguanylate cyclase (GGDEF)-like protein
MSNKDQTIEIPSQLPPNQLRTIFETFNDNQSNALPERFEKAWSLIVNLIKTKEIDVGEISEKILQEPIFKFLVYRNYLQQVRASVESMKALKDVPGMSDLIQALKKKHPSQVALGKMQTELATTALKVAIPNAKTEVQLLIEAATDSLTGLWNKNAFNRYLNYLKEFLSSEEQEEKNMPSLTGVALIMIDIDKFKSMNDTYGHVFGDKILKLVGTTMRPLDLVFRYGGEEFGILWPILEDQDKGKRGEKPLDKDAIAQRAFKALNDIAQQLRVFVEEQPAGLFGDKEKKEDFSLTVSAGIKVFTPEEIRRETPEGMISLADILLYHSKDAGRNRFTFIDDQNEVAVREFGKDPTRSA